MGKGNATPHEHYNLIAAILATFVGCLALGVSVYASYWQKQAVRAQGWPILAWGYTNLEGFSFELSNEGAEPAEIRATHITLEEKRSETGASSSRRSARTQTRDRSASNRSRVTSPTDSSTTICYCSVLDECWVLKAGKRTPVSACEPGDFEN